MLLHNCCRKNACSYLLNRETSLANAPWRVVLGRVWFHTIAYELEVCSTIEYYHLSCTVRTFIYR